MIALKPKFDPKLCASAARASWLLYVAAYPRADAATYSPKTPPQRAPERTVLRVVSAATTRPGERPARVVARTATSVDIGGHTLCGVFRAAVGQEQLFQR